MVLSLAASLSMAVQAADTKPAAQPKGEPTNAKEAADKKAAQAAAIDDLFGFITPHVAKMQNP